MNVNHLKGYQKVAASLNSLDWLLDSHCVKDLVLVQKEHPMNIATPR